MQAIFLSFLEKLASPRAKKFGKITAAGNIKTVPDKISAGNCAVNDYFGFSIE